MSATTEVEAGAEVKSLLDQGQWTGKIYSDGWVDAPAQIETIEPATGEYWERRGGGDPETIARATSSAAAPARLGRARRFTERVAVVRRAAELMESHRAELIHWLIRESGAIPPKADHEITASIGQLETAAALVDQPLDVELPSLMPGRTSTARRIPLGVVGVITPWNFPYVLAMRSVGPALALGNAVVLKPDANTPVTGGVVIARLFEEAGLPEGVLHVLPGDGEVGHALVADPNVRMISFTGSTATGHLVGETAGRMLKRLVLEMGGNSPLVVLDDADIEAASSAGAWGSFLHRGRSASRSAPLVHEASSTPTRTRSCAGRAPAGGPRDRQVALGPIINERQLALVRRIVDESVGQGAKVLAGGTNDGLFFAPTVLGGVTPEMPAFTEEIFGPVAPVTTFRDDAEAVELANATAYGLTAAVQSGSPQRAAAVAGQLRAGMVHINDQTVNEEPPAPFGGVGSSSNGGHFGGVANLELWTEWQWLTSREKAEPFPF
jgi:benzaldehyde dehydrogenase (NAD)